MRFEFDSVKTKPPPQAWRSFGTFVFENPDYPQIIMAIRSASVRSAEAMMAKKSSMVLEADPSDREDFPVNRAALDRAHMGRRIRRLRNRLGLTQEGFAERYGIPLSAIRQYEIARTMPPPAVRAYLTVIEREPEMAARALHPDAA